MGRVSEGERVVTRWGIDSSLGLTPRADSLPHKRGRLGVVTAWDDPLAGKFFSCSG